MHMTLSTMSFHWSVCTRVVVLEFVLDSSLNFLRILTLLGDLNGLAH